MTESNLINNTEPLKREDFDYICRCCLSRNPMANIFQLKFKETFLVDIFKLFNAPVKWDDDLPKTICSLCTATVINFYKFKQMYDKSVETLQNISRNSKEIVKKKGLLLISYENDNIQLLRKDIENDDIKVEEHEITKEEPENENNNLIKKNELLLETNQNHKILPLREEAENKNIKDELVEESQNESNNQENLNDSDNNASTILKQTQKSLQTAISPRKDKYKFTLPYFCKTCNKWISTTGPHKHSTPRKKSHVCEICGKSYLQKAALKIHYRIHKLISLANDENVESDSVFDDTKKQKKKFTYQCSCDETFHSYKGLINHKKEKNHQDPLFRNCEICNKTLTYRAYRGHMRRVHSASSHVESFACEYCGLTFSFKANLKRHIRIHTGEKPHVCEFCGKGFIQKNCLDYHRRSAHTGEKPFVCDFCGKAFILKVTFMNHRRVHTGEKPYLCDNCGKAFRTSLGYNHHIKMKHHEIKEKHHDEMEVQCEICSKFFASIKCLKQHMIRHGEKKYFCDLCKKSFYMKVELDSHMITHTGEKKFICKFCGKGFLKMPYLKLHEKIHTGQKRYTCKICFKAFTQGAHLASHMRTHTGEKPYDCPYCDKSFAHITTRVVHVRSHTGERPYVCDVCSKGFYHSSSMTKHRKSHFKNHVGNKLQESTLI